MASYGIDSNAKLWGYNFIHEKERNDIDHIHDVGANYVSDKGEEIKTKVSKYKRCKFGGVTDKHKFDRISLPFVYSNRKVTEKSELHNLFSILENNKKLAKSRFIDRLCRDGGSPFHHMLSTPQVVNMQRFNDHIYNCRTKNFELMFSDYQHDYKSIDAGSFMPSDYFDGLVQFIEIIEVDTLNKFFTEELFTESFLASKNLQIKPDESILVYVGKYSNYDRKIHNSRDGIPQYFRMFPECLLVPLFELYRIALVAKSNGNFSFKNEDYEVANYFYLKAARYCKFLRECLLHITKSSLFKPSAPRYEIDRRDDEDDEDEEDEEDDDEESTIYETVAASEEESYDESVSVVEDDDTDVTNESPVAIPHDNESIQTEQVENVILPDQSDFARDNSIAMNSTIDQNHSITSPVTNNNKKDVNIVTPSEVKPSVYCNHELYFNILDRDLLPELLKSIYNNLVATYIKMTLFNDALNICYEAFSFIKTNKLSPDAKLLFRKATINAYLQEYEEVCMTVKQSYQLTISYFRH